MPTNDDRNRIITKITELTKTEFHGGSSFWKGERKIPPDWNYYQMPVSRSEILADLGDGYESKPWREMGEEDRRDVLTTYVKRDGFTTEEFGRLIDNVMKDEGRNANEWFAGIDVEAQPPIYDPGQYARYAPSMDDMDHGPTR